MGHVRVIPATLIALSVLIAQSGRPAEASSDSVRATPAVIRIAEDGIVACGSPTSESLSFLEELRIATPGSPAAASAGDAFQVTYNNFTADAQQAFERALEIWAPYLSVPVPITINATFSDQVPPGFIASVGPTELYRNQPGLPQANTFFNVALANQLTGQDLNPASVDIEAVFGSDIAFYTGLDGDTPAGQIDLITIVLHGLAHGLGVTQTFALDGNGLGSVGLGVPANPTILDRSVAYEPENLPLTALPSFTTLLGRRLVDNRVRFTGPRARAAGGGMRPYMQALPGFSTYQSIQHFDELIYPVGTPNEQLTPGVTLGVSNHQLGGILPALLRDLGWAAEVRTQHLAQFGNGAGLVSEVVVFNTSPTEQATVEVRFYDADGNLLDPADLFDDLSGVQATSDSLSFELPPDGQKTLGTTGDGDLLVGSATVSSAGSVTAVIRFSIPGAGVAGVGPSPPAGSVVAPVRQLGSLRTGVAVRNTAQAPVTVDITIEDGAGTGLDTVEWNLAVNGRIAKFIDELVPQLDLEGFSGVLLVEARSGEVAVIALELDSGSNVFTTLPVNRTNR